MDFYVFKEFGEWRLERKLYSNVYLMVLDIQSRYYDFKKLLIEMVISDLKEFLEMKQIGGL